MCYKAIFYPKNLIWYDMLSFSLCILKHQIKTCHYLQSSFPREFIGKYYARDTMKIGLQINQNSDLSQILPKSIENIKDGVKHLVPGFEYAITVSMKGRESTESFRKLSFEERKCKLSHEVDKGSFFKTYSQKNCEYECLIKKAYQSCFCIPWDFLHNLNNVSDCDIFGRTCFTKAIRKWKLEAACPQCIEDCDKIIHTMSIEKETSLELKDNSLFATSRYLYITKTSE